MTQEKYESKHNYNEEYATEQNISRGSIPDGSVSDEEKLYRKKEEYDAKFTLYKGSILPEEK